MRVIPAIALFMVATSGGAKQPPSQSPHPAGATTPAFADGMVDVRSFGAVGDGDRDDSPAIQAALDAGAKQGRPVLVPGGLFRLRSGVRLHSGTRLVGVGAQSELLFEGAAPIQEAISIGSSTDVTVEHLKIRGSPSVVGRLISVRDSSRVLLRECWLEGGGQVAPSANPRAGLFFMGSSDVKVEDNTFTSNGPAEGSAAGYDVVAGYLWSPRGERRFHVTGNRIHGSNTEIAIALFDVGDALVSGNVIDQGNRIGANTAASGYGIMCYTTTAARSPAEACAHAVVSGNIVSNTAGSGIYLQGCLGCTVTGNTLFDTAQRQSDVSLPVAAIAINAGNLAAPYSDVAISGNRIDRSALQGIEIAHARATTVSANSVTGAVRCGIRLRVDVPGAVVTGNTVVGGRQGICVDPSGIDVSLAGNDVAGSSTGIAVAAGQRAAITGNTIRGCASGGIRVEGTDSVVGSNVISNCVGSTAVGIDLHGTRGSAVGNSVLGCGGTGILVEGLENRVAFNTSRDNGRFGIESLGTKNMVQGNVATGNRSGALSLHSADAEHGTQDFDAGREGTVALVNGAATVATPAVQATSRIRIARIAPRGAPGALAVEGISPALSFVIRSSSPTDQSVVTWRIEP